MKQILFIIFFLIPVCGCAAPDKTAVRERDAAASPNGMLEIRSQRLSFVSYRDGRLNMFSEYIIVNTGRAPLHLSSIRQTMTADGGTSLGEAVLEPIDVPASSIVPVEISFGVDGSRLSDDGSGTNEITRTLTCIYDDEGGYERGIRSSYSNTIPLVVLAASLENLSITAPRRDIIMDALEKAGRDPMESASILSIFGGTYSERGIELLGTVDFDFRISYDIILRNMKSATVHFSTVSFQAEMSGTLLGKSAALPVPSGKDHVIHVSEHYNTRNFNEEILSAYTSDSPEYLIRIKTRLTGGNGIIGQPIPCRFFSGGTLEK